MHCKSCGAEIDDSDRFCHKCGATVVSQGAKPQPAAGKVPGRFHRFCVGSLVVWTALWAGLTFSVLGLTSERATQSTGAMIGVAIGLGMYAFFWFLPSLVLGVVAVATRPSPYVGWPRGTKVATTILAVLVFLWPFSIRGWRSSGTNVTTTSTTNSSRAPVPRQDSPTGKWHVSESKSEMDGSPLVVLDLDAGNEVQGWLEAKKPTLIIRCKERKTALYVDIGMQASVEPGDYGLYNQHTVRIRLDDKPALKQVWGQSTDGKALFAGSPQQLARQIAQSQTVLFEFTPFQASPATARFDVHGLDKVLQKVAVPCGWTKELETEKH